MVERHVVEKKIVDGVGLVNIQEGDSYFLNSGFIALTDATESALLFVTNDEARSLVIESISVDARESVPAATAHCLVRVIRDPTLISISGAVVQSNINYGSAKTLSATLFAGGQSGTFTGGNLSKEYLATVEQTFETKPSIVLPSGTSIGLSVLPPSGTTSISVNIGLKTYLAKA